MPSATSFAESQPILSNPPISPVVAPNKNARRASLKVLSRNVDKVILGNLLFRTWYYSPYPDSIILGEENVSSNAGATVAGSAPASASARHHYQQSGANVNANGVPRGSSEYGAPSTTTKAAQPPPTACSCLHVCPYCFRYTPKAEAYTQHLRWHNVTYDPYSASHPSDAGSPSSPTSDQSEDTSTWPVPGSAVKVYGHGGYTVWDIDGEREKLYCQNLSLFGKLFLEQKSVFFDTGGFHYFVLTYTPPPPPPTDTPGFKTGGTRTSGRQRTSSGVGKVTGTGTTTASSASTLPSTLIHPVPPDINLNTQVLGFFSKENLSWDANNLACILVFPPYQHRNLGQLLMAVSYKLSGWEWEDSIIGGPEKPLSAMGRRSYLRFWSERVARFFLGQTADADGRRVFDDTRRDNRGRKRKRAGFSREEMTVKEIGDRTGMLAEDVVAALNEMGVLEVVPPKKKKQRKSDEQDTGGGGGGGGGAAAEEQALSVMVVHRSKVLDWAKEKDVDLVSPVREEGFLGEWALSELDEDEDEDGDEDKDDELEVEDEEIDQSE